MTHFQYVFEEDIEEFVMNETITIPPNSVEKLIDKSDKEDEQKSNSA